MPQQEQAPLSSNPSGRMWPRPSAVSPGMLLRGSAGPAGLAAGFLHPLWAGPSSHPARVAAAPAAETLAQAGPRLSHQVVSGSLMSSQKTPALPPPHMPTGSCFPSREQELSWLMDTPAVPSPDPPAGKARVAGVLVGDSVLSPAHLDRLVAPEEAAVTVPLQIRRFLSQVLRKHLRQWLHS